jgi:hypothetical protein
MPPDGWSDDTTLRRLGGARCIKWWVASYQLASWQSGDNTTSDQNQRADTQLCGLVAQHERRR